MIRDNWNEVWDAFDRHKGAEAATADAPNEGVDDAQGELIGVAAE